MTEGIGHRGGAVAVGLDTAESAAETGTPEARFNRPSEVLKYTSTFGTVAATEGAT